MKHFSILDLCSVVEGSTPAQALANSADIARLAEDLGYHRFWLAEHHNMSGIASAATAVVIGHVGAATKTIRIGAGGIMLPNHSPMVIAEQFGTLAQLFPGRVDLGVGRAPGTDMETARAIRRQMGGEDSFPQDVVDLMGFFSQDAALGRVQAVPAAGTNVPVWILGSSMYGAQLAAYLGLPYAFASHFAPTYLAQAVATYRASFRPSEFLSEPHFMLAMGMCAAETDAEANFLRSSQMLSFARLRTGRAGLLPKPTHDLSEIPAHLLPELEHTLSVAAVGGPETVRRQMEVILERYAPDEVIFAGMVHSHEARRRSIEIAAEVCKGLI